MPDNFKILNLTEVFYLDYPDEQYPELMRKKERPYTCLTFDFKQYTVCIPFRTEMRHKNGYHFKNSDRAKRFHSGLDYSKTVIVLNADYLSSDEAVVDNDEFKECLKNRKRIIREAEIYINDYVDCENGKLKLHSREYKRRYQYTTLQYFREELGIKESQNSAGSSQIEMSEVNADEKTGNVPDVKD